MAQDVLYQIYDENDGVFTAINSDGTVIPLPSFGYEVANVHGIDLFYIQRGLAYPNTSIY